MSSSDWFSEFSRPLLRIGCLIALLMAASCSETPVDEAAVRAQFEAFQDALYAGDRPALRRLVTRESLPAIESVALEEVAERPPLVIAHCEPETTSRWHVAVHEASAKPAARGVTGEATFVVKRQDSHWRIDLVDSALANNRTYQTVQANGPEIVPTELDPREIDRIRATNPGLIR